MRKADVAFNIRNLPRICIYVCNCAAHIDTISYIIEQVKHNIDKIYSSIQTWPLCLSRFDQLGIQVIYSVPTTKQQRMRTETLSTN